MRVINRLRSMLALPRPVALYVLLLAVLAASPTVHADNPSPPGGLRYEVYSATAAEIFWGRSTDDVIVVAYEIQINGNLVATLDALSYYTDTLTAGTAYDIMVTAVDNDGNRSTPATVDLTAGDRTPQNSRLPTPPDNLRVNVYSSTAFELFWERVTDKILTYEILIDGDLVATTEGTSWFTAGQEPGRQYVVDVVAINAAGDRSGAAVVIVTLEGGVDGISVDAPSAPQNTRIVVYSSTAAELFWDRPPFTAQIVDTKVLRDGALITVTNGISYFDETRAPGRTYRYELIAVNAQGVESFPTLIDETDGGIQSAGEILNLMSGQDLIAHASIVSERLNQAMGVATLQEVVGPIETVEDPSASIPTIITSTQSVFRCNGGGTLERTKTKSRYAFEFETNLFSAINCKSQFTDNQSISFSGSTRVRVG